MLCYFHLPAGYNTPEDVDEKLIDPRMWKLFQRSLILQVSEFFNRKILRKRPCRDQNAHVANDESGTREPLNNFTTKDTKDYEMDTKGVV